MTSAPDFGRIWQYRFLDATGEISPDRLPTYLGGPFDGDATARAAAAELRAVGVHVVRVERLASGGRWQEVLL